MGQRQMRKRRRRQWQILRCRRRQRQTRRCRRRQTERSKCGRACSSCKHRGPACKNLSAPNGQQERGRGWAPKVSARPATPTGDGHTRASCERR